MNRSGTACSPEGWAPRFMLCVGMFLPQGARTASAPPAIHPPGGRRFFSIRRKIAEWFRGHSRADMAPADEAGVPHMSATKAGPISADRAVVTITITITVDGGAVAVRQAEHPKPRSPAVGTSDSVPTDEPVEPTGNEGWAGERGLLPSQIAQRESARKWRENHTSATGNSAHEGEEDTCLSGRVSRSDEQEAGKSHEESEVLRGAHGAGGDQAGETRGKATAREERQTNLEVRRTPDYEAAERATNGTVAEGDSPQRVASPTLSKMETVEIDLTPPASLLAKRKEIEQRRAGT